MTALDLPKSSQYKVYVEGHGCSANLADTEIISGMVSRHGFKIVDDWESADLSVLVTCTVKSVTEQRMLNRIRELRSGGQKVVVAGCLSKAEPNKVLAIDPKLSLVGPGNLDRIVPIITSGLEGNQSIAIEDERLVKLGMPRTRRNGTIGIVEIASGCLSSCTFCQVKLVKGAIFSYPEEKIVEETSELISQGAREIWLTSTDNSAYGRDSKTTLSALLRKICSLPGDFKVRVGMMNPLLTKAKALGDLVEAYQHEKVFKFLHLPVQSGSNRILKLMQRGYSIDDYYATIEAFRSDIRDLSLSTDIIVGFPTETEDDFEESIALLKRSKPDVLNLSKFGARDGTKAAIMDGQIPAPILKDRSRRMSAIWKKLALETNRKWIGRNGTAIVDERVRGAFIARNDSYRPCLLQDELLSDKDLMGRVVQLRVDDVSPFTLRAVLV